MALMWIVGLLGLFHLCSGVSSNKYPFCQVTFPQNGTWFESEWPYWQDDNCPPTVHLSKDQIVQCLRNRTVFVMGNSIARQFGFTLAHMLTDHKHDEYSRHVQKQLCLKNVTNFLASKCKLDIEGVHIRPMTMEYYDGVNYTSRGGFPFTKNVPVYPAGQSPYNTAYDLVDLRSEPPLLARQDCGPMSMRTCYHEFFANSTRDDVLIFQIGLAYSYFGLNFTHPKIDKEKWLIHDVAAFRQHLEAVFKGTVFMLTMSPKNSARIDTERKKAQHYQMKYLNDVIIKSAFFPVSSRLEGEPEYNASKWYVIDLWPICYDRAPKYYADEIHFPGPLANAIVMQILNRFCLP